MKLTPTMYPDVVKLNDPSGVVLTFVGLSFLGGGVLMFLSGVGVIPTQSDTTPLIIIGGIMSLLGIFISLLRFGATIDRRSMTALKWWGLIAPMSRKEIVLPADGKVTIKKEIRRSKNSSYTVYAVRLGDSASNNLMDIEAPRDYQAARVAAEEIARFLRWSVADCSSGSEIVREHDKLDESLRDKIKREGGRVEITPAPFALQTAVSQSPDGVVFDFPAPGFMAFDYLRLLAPLFGFVFLFGFSIIVDGFDFVTLGFVGVFFMIPFIILLPATLSKTKKKSRVTINADALTVEERGFGRTKTMTMALKELEEMEISGPGISAELKNMLDQANKNSPGEYAPNIPDAGIASSDPLQQSLANPTGRKLMMFISKLIPGSHIVIRSDKLTIQIGHGLSKEELEYLCGEMKKTIAG